MAENMDETIFKHKANPTYRLSRTVLTDNELSRSTQVIALFLLKKSDDWEYKNTEICEGVKMSRHTSYKALNQLMAKGYLKILIDLRRFRQSRRRKS